MAVPERRPPSRTPTAWDPWEELQHTMNRLHQLAERTFADLPTAVAEGGFVPAADVEETDDAYVLDIELPGVRKQDVHVETQGRRITVSGERKERERTGILRRRTRVTGRFHYEVTLPGDIDADEVAASMDEGVLTVRVPKAADERTRSRKVEIS